MRATVTFTLTATTNYISLQPFTNKTKHLDVILKQSERLAEAHKIPKMFWALNLTSRKDVVSNFY